MPLVVDLLKTAQEPGLEWKAAWPGVDRCVLYEEPGGPAAALLRYTPGASSPRHRHAGYEHIYVISGSQRDERGHYPAGTLVVNDPGSEHQVTSDDGCVALLIWQEPVVFAHG
jgi:anti-sigma factor ChrR (cupin superfamily)